MISIIVFGCSVTVTGMTLADKSTVNVTDKYVTMTSLGASTTSTPVPLAVGRDSETVSTSQRLIIVTTAVDKKQTTQQKDITMATGELMTSQPGQQMLTYIVVFDF